jgi:hypothetical protein
MHHIEPQVDVHDTKVGRKQRSKVRGADGRRIQLRCVGLNGAKSSCLMTMSVMSGGKENKLEKRCTPEGSCFFVGTSSSLQPLLGQKRQVPLLAL